jgi:drug/metabolite transporter (DMT)-like permease
MWGFGGIFAVLATAPGLVITFYRLWISAGLYLVILYASGRRLTWATLRGSWLGGLFLTGDMATFFSAVKLTSILDVTVILAVQPAVVLLVARRMFDERMGRWDVAWIVVAIVGVCVAVVGSGVKSHHQMAGDLLAVGALLCWSSYWLVSKRASAATDSVEYTAGVGLVAAVALTPILWISGQSLDRVEPGDWTWIILLTVIPGGAYFVMNWAHRYVEASVSSAMSCLSPLVAAVAAYFILNQPLTLLQISGVVMGLAGVAVVAARHLEPSGPRSP